MQRNLLLLSGPHPEIKNFIPTTANVAFIASALTPAVGNYIDDVYEGYLYQAMKKWGYDLHSILLEELSKDEIKEQINECDALVVAGGNTFYLLQEIHKKDLAGFICDKIRGGMPYVGESAGAMILSPDISYVKPMDDINEAPELTSTSSFWIHSENIIPHINHPEVGAAATDMRKESINPILIPEGYAVLVNGGDIKHIKEKKKLIVFLHGFGFSVENDNPEFQQELAKQLNCDVVGINGPYDSGRERGGYCYYPITPGDRRHLLDGYLDKSLAYLQGRIYGELDKRALTWNDLILVGHSHGGAIALLLGLGNETPCHAIIEIAGRALKSYGLEFSVNSRPQVLWVEAEDNDTGRARCKESAETIEQLDVPVDYHVCPKSGHETLDFNIAKIIKDNLK